MNTPEFWQAVDQLVATSEIVIDRPKGIKHPKVDLIYPLNYGYLASTRSPDGEGIDVWCGDGGDLACNAIVCTVDLVKRDSEIKLLLGCTDEEIDQIMVVYSQWDTLKGVLIRRIDC